MTDLADRRGYDGEVYQPAEDSALLAGVVSERVRPTDRVLDVGTGSGYVAGRLAEEAGAAVVGSDVDAAACRRAQARGIPAVRADLTTPFRSGTFDVVVFNPPYLPANPELDLDDPLRTALVGGATGREVIERFLDDLGRVLADGGEGFLLVSTVSGLAEVVEYAGSRGFSAAAVADAPFPGETLTVLRLWE